MNYISKLEIHEVNEICSAIPYNDVITYFTKNPKEFAKIHPGFRPKTISKNEAKKLLFDNYDQHFIASYINMYIGKQLKKISSDFNDLVSKGYNNVEANIKSLTFSCFSNNISIFFKLTNGNYSPDYLTMMKSAIGTIIEIEDSRLLLIDLLAKNEQLSLRLTNELKSSRSDTRLAEAKVQKKTKENGILVEKNKRLNEQVSSIKLYEKEVSTLQKKNARLTDTNKSLSEQIRELKKMSKERIVVGNESIEHQEPRSTKVNAKLNSPKRPIDIEEFIEFLGFNLVNIGTSPSEEYFTYLTKYISKISFTGAPILTNHVVGYNLAMCISNSLIGTSKIDVLTYSKGVKIEYIDEFISKSKRIVILDNFICNYNETELIPIFERNVDKIIILTTPYDRTIRYISKEFLRYCNYINVNRVKSLTLPKALTEDPSTIVEVENYVEPDLAENRYRKSYRAILLELDFPYSIVEKKCDYILSDDDITQSLLFDILPYITDVMQESPFNMSDGLSKYVNASGRSTNRSILKRWFSYE